MTPPVLFLWYKVYMKEFKLPKSITSKMTATECKMFSTLKKKDSDALADMIKRQRKYTQVSRKSPNSKTLPALLKAGFKAESKAFKSADKVKAFIVKMRAKY